MKDRGMGLPLQATEDDFTEAELEDIGFVIGGMVNWRGERWRVLSVSPLLIECRGSTNERN